MFGRFRPSRMQAEPPKVVSNLDDILTKPIAFILHGREHRIEPITTERFLKWSEALAGLYALKEKKVNATDLIKVHADTIRSVCPSITVSDIEKCEQSQIAAIYGLIFNHVSGSAHSEDEKKKMRDMTHSGSGTH